MSPNNNEAPPFQDRRIGTSDRRQVHKNTKTSSPKQARKSKQTKQEISLNIVRILEEEYRRILSLLNQLFLSIELASYKQLQENIQSLNKKLKENLEMEEDMLFLFVDSMTNKSFKEKYDIHKLLDNFIYGATQKTIRILAPYLNITITETNVSMFLEDAYKIDRLLANNHKIKENYLYRMYTKCVV